MAYGHMCHIVIWQLIWPIWVSTEQPIEIWYFWGKEKQIKASYIKSQSVCVWVCVSRFRKYQRGLSKGSEILHGVLSHPPEFLVFLNSSAIKSNIKNVLSTKILSIFDRILL